MKLLERVTRTENTLREMVKAIQAITRVVGVSEVQAELATAAKAEMKAQVDNALKEGKLAPTETVSDNSFMVLTEKDKNGNPAFPGRLQLGIKDLAEESRALFLGKKAGETVQVPNGSFTVDHVYDLIDQPAQANA